MYNSAAFFLGSNTPGGFYSLFDGLYNPYEGWKAYIIKGGPGTGKSGLLKRVADSLENVGLLTERIYCASDPSSLDAVIFPEVKVSLADGTAPHVLEPKFPGASEEIINLGEFWDVKKLRANADTIIKLSLKCSSQQKRCVKFLDAVGSAHREISGIVQYALEEDKIDRYVSRLVARKFGTPRGKIGREYRRFINAITMHGNLFLTESAEALCDDAIILRDDYGVVAPIIAAQLRRYALGNGLDVISCVNPLSTDANLRHVIIPEIGFGFFSEGDLLETSLPFGKRINVSRFLDCSYIKEHRNRLGFAGRVCAELTDEAFISLRDAKLAHDELERFYIEAMNFDKVHETSERIISEIEELIAEV